MTIDHTDDHIWPSTTQIASTVMNLGIWYSELVMRLALRSSCIHLWGQAVSSFSHLSSKLVRIHNYEFSLKERNRREILRIGAKTGKYKSCGEFRVG